MKILLTNNFGEAMKTQSQNTITVFIEAINKLEDMAKPEILLIDSIINLSSSDDKITPYAYHKPAHPYRCFGRSGISFPHQAPSFL